MIKETVSLGFDPKTSNPEIQAVFADDLARTLWLAIKQSGFLASQYFCRNLLRCSEEIKRAKKKGPLDNFALFRILGGFGRGPTCGVIGPSDQVFAEELLPFVTGEKTISFVVKER
jgi:hypothetical protein